MKEKHPFFGKNHNEKYIRLMSINSSKAKPVTIINTKTNEKSKFNSNLSASKFLGVSEWTVRKYKNNNKLYKNIYKIIKNTLKYIINIINNKKKPEKLNW